MVKSINNNNNRKKSLLENMKQWAILQQDLLTIQDIRRINQHIIEEVILPLQEVSSLKEIDVEVNCQKLQVNFDKDVITDAIRNLVNNAIKFSKVGTKIIINTSKSSYTTFIHIQDFELGMNLETIENILKSKRHHAREGTAD